MPIAKAVERFHFKSLKMKVGKLIECKKHRKKFWV